MPGLHSTLCYHPYLPLEEAWPHLCCGGHPRRLVFLGPCLRFLLRQGMTIETDIAQGARGPTTS